MSDYGFSVRLSKEVVDHITSLMVMKHDSYDAVLRRIFKMPEVKRNSIRAHLIKALAVRESIVIPWRMDDKGKKLHARLQSTIYGSVQTVRITTGREFKAVSTPLGLKVTRIK